MQRSLTASGDKLAASESDIKRLREELGQLKVIIADLRADNQKLDKLLSSERVQLSLSRDDAVTLQTQLAECKLQLGEDGSLLDKLHGATVSLQESKRALAKAHADLEAEVSSRAQAVKDLGSERSNHTQTREKVAGAIQDLQKERKAHQQLQTELDRRVAALQAEITNHNQTKIDISKLRLKLAAMEASREDLVGRSELAKVQADLDAEKKLHAQRREALEKFESSVASKKVSWDLAETERDKVNNALLVEKEAHKETKKELDRLLLQLNKERDDRRELVPSSEVAKVQLKLESEVLAHSKVQRQLELVQESLTSEKKYVQTELESKASALQAEMASHSQTKEDIMKLQAELIEERATRGKMVERDAVVKVQLKLEAERRAHAKAKQDLEELQSSSLSEKSFQSLTRTTLASAQQQLETERREHRETLAELSKLETALQLEQSAHNEAKIQLVTLETELSTERANQSELRQSLEKIRANQGEQEAEMELLRASQSKDSELIGQMKSQREQEKAQLEGLKASHNQVLTLLSLEMLPYLALLFYKL